MSLKKTRIKGNLSVEGIRSIQRQLYEYQKTLNAKTQLFVDKLADIGISVAYENADGDSHKFSSMVKYSKHWQGTKLYLIGTNNDLSGLHTEWYDADGNFHDETISPIQALEFGTAGLAIKGHKGTAAVTGNHVNDTSWFYYEDAELTQKHYATAEEAHEPMYNAALEMKKQITRIAREVFR